MAHSSFIDTASLYKDIGLAIEYASHAGLLQDCALLSALQSAEQQDNVDAYTLTRTLNELVKLISPITLSDLRQGKSPASVKYQKKSRHIRLFLTVLALLTLFFIGSFMQSLHDKQEALQSIERIQQLQPELKLVTLRKMAQYDQPIQNNGSLNDEFHRKVIELKEINRQVNAAFQGLKSAAEAPFLLLPDLDWLDITNHLRINNIGLPAAQAEMTPAAGVTLTNKSKEIDLSGAGDSPGAGQDALHDFCSDDSNGGIQTPTDVAKYPQWMRHVIADSMSDFCFQLRVLSSDGYNALLSQSMNQFSFATLIKDRIQILVEWILPFLYGTLGSLIYLMRNTSDARAPANSEWLPIVMRISLGGVAGIVIGWFASATGGLEKTSVLSLPFGLAFLTGYGIEVLFAVLDRLNRSLGELPAKAATAK
jgi:hypothetical protein